MADAAAANSDLSSVGEALSGLANTIEAHPGILGPQVTAVLSLTRTAVDAVSKAGTDISNITDGESAAAAADSTAAALAQVASVLGLVAAFTGPGFAVVAAIAGAASALLQGLASLLRTIFGVADPSEPPVDTDGPETDGTETDGTETDGTETDGTETDGTETDGTQTDGTETDGTQTETTDTSGTDLSGTTDSTSGPLGQTTGSGGPEEGHDHDFGSRVHESHVLTEEGEGSTEEDDEDP